MPTALREVTVVPFEDQKPGTSGLRKKVVVFQQPHYVETFVQSTFDAVVATEGSLEGATLVVGGDGRYLVRETLQTIIRMAHANKVGRLIVGQNGLFSTPAVSALIRRQKARGGIILTASHNPGGPDEDFGIKYNIANGGPAPGSLTDKIYAVAKSITRYFISELPEVDLGKKDSHVFDHLVVDVVDPVDDYVTLMKELFDFAALKEYVQGGNAKLHIDCLSGVAGPYARRIFVDELGASADAVVNAEPLPDFGGGHPDPNLVYAKSLVDAMATGKYDFGAAFDGDADRNMILGKNAFFVTPSDSVAVLAANADCIPHLAREGLKGVSRSMPTAAALDRVAEKLKLQCYEVPTGWKFFGNLMDAGRLSICGEESFGTGSNHIREKDGVWAALAWLSVMYSRKMSIEDIMMAHWNEFGRNFFTRYDYENVESGPALQMMAHLEAMALDATLLGKTYSSGHTLAKCDNFEYTDCTNNEVTLKQGIRLIFSDNSRIIFRLSGTGSSGATIRMYVDSYKNDPTSYKTATQDALKPLVDLALEVSKLEEFTGRKEPTVIT